MSSLNVGWRPERIRQAVTLEVAKRRVHPDFWFRLPFSGSRRLANALPKQSFAVKDGAIAHHIHNIYVARGFMCQRFGRDRPVSLGTLSLIEAMRGLVVADDAVGGFDKRPGKIGVAVLAVVHAFLLVVAQAFVFDAAEIGGEPAHDWKTVDVIGFEGDGKAEDIADTVDRQERLEFGLQQ